MCVIPIQIELRTWRDSRFLYEMVSGTYEWCISKKKF